MYLIQMPSDQNLFISRKAAGRPESPRNGQLWHIKKGALKSALFWRFKVLPPRVIRKFFGYELGWDEKRCFVKEFVRFCIAHGFADGGFAEIEGPDGTHWG
jgi:hypothetical protein